MKISHFNIVPEEQITKYIMKAYNNYNFKNKKILVVIPDNSRTAPIDIFFKLFYKIFWKNTKKLDYLIALGTHPLLTEDEKLKRVGISKSDKETIYKDVNIINHRWDKKDTFVKIGSISKSETLKITDGLIDEGNDVFINKIIYDYDTIIVLGPVFPHEIVGFSGSNKYFFPGICGWNFIDTTHWLGAVRTNLKTIGYKDTPVRSLIDRASEFIKMQIVYFNLVVDEEGLKGLFIGDDRKAWLQAVELSSKINIKYLHNPLKKAISIPSNKYEDFWTGAKAIYKIEPSVEDGGNLIVYAPHIKDFSITHNAIIKQIGYHIKDYFLNNISKYSKVPKAVLAYSTYVKGSGNLTNGKEIPRINIFLSSGISKKECEKVNIDYLNPDNIDISNFEHKEDEGIKVFHNSGEVLYRIK